MANCYSLGIDVGSTTVKTVIIDSDNQIIYSKYQRHLSKVKFNANLDSEAGASKWK